MSCLSSARRATLNARLTTKQAQLVKLEAAYDSALTNSEVQSYTFASGAGSQSTRRRDPEEIQRLIRALESDIDGIQRELSGSGIVTMNVRRH